MAKNWWFKFEYRVWQSDPELSRCSLGARGFWLEMVAAMHSQDTHTIRGTYEQLARMARCETSEIAKYALELKETNSANVTLGHGEVTLSSRRLKRELTIKENNKLRKRKERVTEKSQDRVKSKEKEVINKKEIREETPQAATPKKGTRLPDQFFLTAEMKAWAVEKKPSVDLALETEKFCNHFRAAPGRQGTKLNWLLTWKNWILNSRGMNGHHANNGASVGKSDYVDPAYDCPNCFDRKVVMKIAENNLDFKDVPCPECMEVKV